MNAALYEGATNRSGNLVSDPLTSSIAEYTLAIPRASAVAITDYASLELRIWGTSATDAVPIEVAEAWLDTPPLPTAYELAVLGTTGLVHYWRLNEFGGGVAQDQRGALDGAYNGSPTLGASGLLPIEAAAGRAVSLDGVNDYVEVPDAATLDVTEAVSAEFWVEAPSYPADDTLVQKGAAWSFWMAGLNLRFEVDGVGPVEAPVSAGGKYHVVGTYNRTTMAIYLNGKLAASAPFTAAITATTGNLRIGADTGGAPLYHQGVYSDVAFYNVALDAPTVLSHYEAAVPPSGITARDFDGTDDRILTAIGDCNIGASDPYSLAALVRFDSFGSFPAVMALGSSTSMGTYLTVNTAGKLGVGNGAADSFVPAGEELIPGEWYFIGADNGSGTGVPRLHICRLSVGTWEHFDGDISIAHGTQTLDRVIFGVWINDLSSQLDGQLAVAGVWKRRLSDSEWATLDDGKITQAWGTLSPNGLWNFNQASVASPVLDLSSAGTADEVTINGTSVTNDGPPAWDYTTGPAAPTFTDMDAAATSGATLAISAPTRVPLNAAASTSGATLALTAPTRIPLATAAATSSATLSLTARTTVPLASAAASSSASLALTAAAKLTLAAATATSSASLTLSARTFVPLNGAAASSGATLAVGVPKLLAGGVVGTSVLAATLAITQELAAWETVYPHPIGSAGTLQGRTLLTGDLVVGAGAAPATLPLGTAAASSSATLNLTARTTVPLVAAAATSSAALTITPTRVPLAAAAAVSGSTLAISARTTVPLNAAPATSGASLALTAPTRVPLAAAVASSGASLALNARTTVPLATAAATSSSSLALSAPALLPLGTAAASSGSTLALSARTTVPLAAAAAVADAILVLRAPTVVPLAAAAAVSGATLTLGSTAVPMLALATAASSDASLAISARTTIPLAAAAASSSASLALTAPALLALGTAAASSGAALTVKTGAPLTLTAAASSSAALTLQGVVELVLTAPMVSGATLALTARTTVPLVAAAAVSSSSLALRAPTRVPLAAAAAVSNATLSLTAPTRVPLGTAASASSSSLALSTRTTIPLAASAAVSGATLALTAAPTLALAAAATSTASLALSARTTLQLAPAAATSGGALSLSGKPEIAMSIAALSGASLALTARTTVPLGSASAVSSAALALSIPVPVALAPAAATSGATLALRTALSLPLAPASATSDASLTLRARALLTLAPVAASSGATLALSARTAVPLAPVVAQSGASLALSAPARVALAPSAATSGATLKLGAAAQLELSTHATSGASLTFKVPVTLTLSAEAQSDATLVLSYSVPLVLTADATSGATLRLSIALPIDLWTVAAPLHPAGRHGLAVSATQRHGTKDGSAVSAPVAPGPTRWPNSL